MGEYNYDGQTYNDGVTEQGDDQDAPGYSVLLGAQKEENRILKEKEKAAAEAAAAAAAKQAYNNHFEYGGGPGGAGASATWFQNEGIASQGRQGEKIDYGLAQGYNAQAQQNAGMQGNVAGLMYQRAIGAVPSIAQMQADRQMQQAAAAQTSAAASARGPAGLALAQQGAAANTAAMQSNISGQAQINGAQERQQAEQAAFGAYSGMRGQDFQGMGMQADMAQKQAALNAAQRAQNDQYSMGLYGLGVDVNKAQLGAQGNQIAIEAGMQTSANGLAQQKSQHDQDRADRWGGYALAATGTAAGIAVPLIFGGKGGGGGPSGVGGNGDSGYGGPGSTPGGYDAGTGAPTAGSGGGFDPDDPSDVTAKQNISPLGSGLNQSGLNSGPGMGAGFDASAAYGGAGAQQFASPQQGLMLSDTRAKQDAHELRIKQARASAWEDGQRSARSDMQDPRMAKAQAMLDAMGEQRAGLMAQGPSVRDPLTDQFAQGLAPSAYDYKEGIPGATAGRKVGPMAQNMAANPVTGTAVRQDPRTGLLGIDHKDGLKVALAASGHLAQKQQATDAEVAKLRAIAEQMQQSQQAQNAGLMSQGASVGGDSLADPRLMEAQRLLSGQQSAGQAQLGMGPSVGRTYLDYVRGQ